MDALRFTTEDGVSIEGELRAPEGEPRGSCVLCHPHPRGGGSKDHPILWAIRDDLVGRGLAVLAFNFRGVMGSGGSYGGGRTEVRDVAAAIGRVREATTGPTLVCGWSFGANVGLREAITDERVGGLALVGIPVGGSGLDLPPLPTPSELRAFRRPVLLVSGQRDTFSPVPELESLAREIRASELAIVPGTDHFFWRREAQVAERVGDFADRALFG